MSTKVTSLQAAQYAFANAIRDPDNHLPPAGVSAQRLAVYHELFFNNFRNSLESAYPVLHDVVEPSLWEELVSGFFREHRCHTPEFPRMPREFLDWLTLPRDTQEQEPAFLPQLALWEWTELEVLLDPAIPMRPLRIDADLLDSQPVLVPSLRLHRFDYPVHRIAPGYLPDAALSEPVHLAAYRNAQDEAAFLELSPVSAALLQNIQENHDMTGAEHIDQLASLMGHPRPEQLFTFAAAFLDELRDKGVLLGGCTSTDNGDRNHV
ncbi:MAG: DUF2063 domain-containing protein [Thiohalomonadaceae bacterium]